MLEQWEYLYAISLTPTAHSKDREGYAISLPFVEMYGALVYEVT